MHTLTVNLDARSYPIHLGHGLLADAASLLAPQLAAGRAILITDESVAAHYLLPLQAALSAANIHAHSIIVPAGEGSKSFSRFEWLCNEILAQTPDRHTPLIALGGGVVGDLTGFAASVLLRGVPFIQIPTTLLAMVDSSVGGKTGINTAAGKNMVGSFYQPQAVLMDTATLATLPPRQMRAGYAEMAKTALLGDATFWHWLSEHGAQVVAGDQAALAHAIATCCAAKAAIVAADEREGGVRALLNLGHTFGHALEAEHGFSDALLHGEAVALGLVMAARLSHSLGYTAPDLTHTVAQHLKAVGLPTTLSDIPAPHSGWNREAIAHHFVADKKSQGSALTFILLRAIGEAFIARNVEAEAALKAMDEA